MHRAAFKKNVWAHYTQHGRHALPWRKNPTPYRVLVSEVMLQQTQVDRVIPKYQSFLKQFPSFKALSKTPLRTVLKEWQGLGYNRRALNLKRAAQIITKNHNGRLPKEEKELQQLPGIGPYTAGAIRAFAFNEPAVFIETNIRSVFIHTFYPNQDTVSDSELLPLIERSLETTNPREWYYALMDYGAYLKNTHGNPNRKSAHHSRQSPFRGSNRELRGKIVKALLTNSHSASALAHKVHAPKRTVSSVLKELEREGLVHKKQGVFSIR